MHTPYFCAKMFEISPGLFVGDSKDAYSESGLIHNGIQAIIIAARGIFVKIFFHC